MNTKAQIKKIKWTNKKLISSMVLSLCMVVHGASFFYIYLLYCLIFSIKFVGKKRKSDFSLTNKNRT